MTTLNTSRFRCRILVVLGAQAALAALLGATLSLSTYESLSGNPFDVSTIKANDHSKIKAEDHLSKSKAKGKSPPDSFVLVEKHDDDYNKQNQKRNNKHDFSYDRERWDKNGPRIVVLAGPHKTASTTLQSFFVNLIGQPASVVTNTPEKATTSAGSQGYAGAEWVWPVGVEDECIGKFRYMPKHKFYAPLAAFFSGMRDKEQKFFPRLSSLESDEGREEVLASVGNYFRALFRRPWEDGKKILIGAELFDSLVLTLGASNHGEETHVNPNASNMLDKFLDLLPWDESNNTTRSSDTNDVFRAPNLQLENIEISINYRTPRIDHVKSMWHEFGGNATLQDFVLATTTWYPLNSLALALQFVRKGIKTTIIDMKGASGKESNNSTVLYAIKENTIDAVVGGLRGVVACDVLKMGTDSADPSMFCDKESKLHILDIKKSIENQNQKGDKKSNSMTNKQMEDINRVLEEYDCGVWQHLKKYQEQGLLRILFPSEDLFKTCNPDKSIPDISFQDTLSKARAIASRFVAHCADCDLFRHIKGTAMDSLLGDEDDDDDDDDDDDNDDELDDDDEFEDDDNDDDDDDDDGHKQQHQ